MKKYAILASSLALAVSVSAAPINVTSPDGFPVGKTFGNYNGGENDALNFGSNALQEFDLEAFFFDRSTNSLSMQSGFNVDATHRDFYDVAFYNIELGDIFVDVGGNNSFDYAVVFNRSNGVFSSYDYSVVDLSAGYTDVGLIPEYSGLVYDRDHSAALPFAVATYSGPIVGSGTFSYSSFSDDEGAHYVMSNIDLSSAVDGRAFTLHLTQGCGNDVMTASVPEPTLISLVGIGLLGLSLIRRKK
jgi:hypothetical protein